MRIDVLGRSRLRLPRQAIRRDIRCALRFLAKRRLGRGLAGLRAIGVVALTDAERRRLNRTFRRRDRAANVLSFHYGSEAELLVAPEFIRREAQAAGRAVGSQLRRMVAHGLLHLADVHHEASRSRARRFEQLEELLMERLGIQ